MTTLESLKAAISTLHDGPERGARRDELNAADCRVAALQLGKLIAALQLESVLFSWTCVS
jgi:hypothetical protein